jgi:hypothetical protein
MTIAYAHPDDVIAVFDHPVHVAALQRNKMSDQLTVGTDALSTLGTLINDRAKRDAIHLAVIPAIAGHPLSPGRRVTFRDGAAYADDQDHDVAVVGIVDPFLVHAVRKGERFWLVLLPRTIQSLRHVWSHPAFPDEPVAGSVRDTAFVLDGPLAGGSGSTGQNVTAVMELARAFDATDPATGSSRGVDDVPAAIMQVRWDRARSQSEAWLRAFCARSDCPNYERVLAEAADPSDSDEEYLHFLGGSAHGEIPPEFWDHVEIVLGRPVERKPKYFSCSC